MAKKGKPSKKYAPPSRGKRSRRSTSSVRIGKGDLDRRRRVVAMEQQMASMRVTLEVILEHLNLRVMHEMKNFITNVEHSDDEVKAEEE